MELLMLTAGVAVGAGLGLWIGWLMGTRRAGAAEATVAALRQQVSDGKVRSDRLERELLEANAARVQNETEAREVARSAAEQRRLLDQAEAKLGDTFQALAAKAL